MSYPTGTILRRTTPFTDKDKLHLNHVKVTGKSPSNEPALGEWSGSSGESVVIQPLEGFGPPASLPVSVGNLEYEVEFMPDENEIVHEQITKPAQRLRALTPEQVFSRVAAETAAQAPVVDEIAEPGIVADPKPAPKAKAKPKARTA